MISRVLRRSIVVVIAIVRNRSCDATAAATVQHCRRSSKQLRHIAVAAVAPTMISRVLRRSTVVAIAIVRNRSCDASAAATVQHCRRSSKQLRHIAVAAVAPAMISRVLRRSTVVVIVIVRNRSCDATVAATVSALSPQQQPGPHPFSSFGWEQRYVCHNRPPVNAGLADNIAQGQAQRDVGVDDRAEQQRPTTEIDCHGGPVPEVSGPPEATAPLAKGGLPLQARDQRRPQPPSGTLSPPTVAISDSAFEEWLQSDNMEMPMFSQSEGPQQSAPTAVTLAATAPAADAVTGTRVFPAVSSKVVAEAPASSADAALAAVPAAAPATGDTVFPIASVGGRPGRPLL